MGECKRNCWTCGWDREGGICDIQENDAGREGLAADTGTWAWGAGLDAYGMPPKDADGCPGWKPKPGAENIDPDFLDSSTMAMGGGQAMRSCGSCNFMPTPNGSCWADPTDGIRAHLRDGGHHCPGWQRGHCPMCDDGHHFDSDVRGPCRHCGRTGPDETVENTDRAQVAAFADSATHSATIRPDSATAATVKDSLMVGAGWRGNLPICRGPGGIAARRMRRAGIAVRGVL